MNQDLLEYILAVSRRMAETHDLTVILNDVMDEAIQLIGAERGYVILVQPDGAPDGTLDLYVRRGPNGQDLTDLEDQVSKSILRQVIETGEPLVLRDAMQDPRFDKAESVVILGLRSVMCVPLISRGEPIGAIYVENRSIRDRFSQDDVAPLVLFANQVAVIVENARLFQSLQRSLDELEVRVQERTAELSEANALLKQEIAERQQTEEALRQERDRAQRYLDISGVIILALDAKGDISLINRKGCEILECEKEEALGQSWFDTFLPRRRKEAVKDAFARLMAGELEGTEHMEGLVLTGSGQERTIHWYNSVLVDEDGNPIGTLSSGEDITERKQAEKAVRELYEQTRRDAESKTTLLREVNHRVKNNLTGIIGLIDTERRYASGENQAAIQKAMDRLVQRIIGLAEVHDILSRSGWAPVSLNDLTERIVASTLNASPFDRQVLVDVTASPIRVSPRQANNLALIVNELVTNTIKYAASEDEMTHIAVHIAEEGDNAILFEYRDDGPGYPEDVLHLEHHGVGLYLVRNLVHHVLSGSLILTNDGGAVTAMRFKVEAGDTT